MADVVRLTDAQLDDLEQEGVGYLPDEVADRWLAALLAEVREARRVEAVLAEWGECMWEHGYVSQDRAPFEMVRREAERLAERKRASDGKDTGGG